MALSDQTVVYPKCTYCGKELNGCHIIHEEKPYCNYICVTADEVGMELPDYRENPVCDKCGNEYDPRIIQVERTLFTSEGPLSQWKCDGCGSWVSLYQPKPKGDAVE